MKLKQIFLASILLSVMAMSLPACKVTFVPSPDVQMQTDVTTGAQKTDALFLKMISANDKSFSSYAPDYAEVEAEINSIYVRDSIRPKGSRILQSAALLRDHFQTYKNDHQARGRLTNGELTAYMNYLRAFWRPLQVEESNL